MLRSARRHGDKLSLKPPISRTLPAGAGFSKYPPRVKRSVRTYLQRLEGTDEVPCICTNQ